MQGRSSISPLVPVTAPAATKEISPAANKLLQNEPGMLPVQRTSIQPKLTVGSPDDPLEDEADAMADTVMRMPMVQRKCAHCEEEEKVQRKPGAFQPSFSAFVQRKCAQCEEEKVQREMDNEEEQATATGDSFLQRKCAAPAEGLLQRQADEEIEDDDEAPQESFVQRKCTQCREEQLQRSAEDEEEIQPKAEQPAQPIFRKKENSAQVTSASVTDGINNTRGSGYLMDGGTRSFMESRFGADFSNVKIHTGSQPAQLSRELNAKAFTVGNDIYFNEGQYNPGSDSGKHLLAHELTHTIQQTGGIQAKSILRETIQREDDVLEEPVVDTSDEEIEAGDEGTKVDAYGIIEPEDGANLWSEPGGKTKLGLLTKNTKVFVDRKLPNDWLSVYVDTHQTGEKLSVAAGTNGYVGASRVNTDIPDPGAWLYKIEEGEGALAIAQKVYKGKFTAEWGKDFRFVVNVLEAVNREKKRNYFFKDKADDSWEKTKTMAGKRIWIPGLDLVNSMHGQLSSGSISYEILSTLGDIGIGVAAFGWGFLKGLLMSIADIFIGAYDLIVMLKELFTKLVNGTLLDDAVAFFKEISQIKWSDIKDLLDSKWNNPDTWERWEFRGYVIGYAVMEIVILVFSVGILSAVKWAGKISKVGKLVDYLSKLPKIAKFIEAAKALKGKAIDKMMAAIKAAQALSEAHGWAARVLRIPFHILNRLSEVDIGKLKKLPQYLREKFARLSEAAMLKCLGCNSPCKVDIHEIEKFLKLATKTGTKLTDPDSVLKALKAASKDIDLRKISAKLRKSPSALMTAIQKAELTDADFAKLADFLTPGPGGSTPAVSYATFVRYLNSVVPAKVGPDIKKMNEIAEAVVAAEKGRGAAMKGPMFEQWIALHIPELSTKTFKRMSFDMSKYGSKGMRQVDRWLPDDGAIWEIKHQLSKVPADQIDDYAKLAGKAAPDGKVVNTVNYLFPNKAAAEANKHISDTYKMGLYYIDEATNKIVKFK